MQIKNKVMKLRGIDEASGDLYITNRYWFQEVTREMIIDEDFFAFEAVISKIDERMNNKIAAIKSRFLKDKYEN